MADGYLLLETTGRLLTEAGGGILLDHQPPLTRFPRPAASLASVLVGHHVPVSRLTFIDDDLETVLATAQLVDGSVTKERSRDTHCSGSAVIANPDGSTFAPRSADGLVWPGRLVRIERGAVVNGSPQYAALMTGIIDEPTETEHSGLVSFTIWSRLHLADQQFAEPVTYATGTRISAVIRAIAELAGLGTDDDFYSLTTGGQTLAAARTFDSSDNMLASMQQLAFDSGCELYDTGQGVVTLAPFVDPATTDPVWEFRGSSTATITDLSRVLKAQPGIFNRAIARGIGADGYPIRGEWKVTNPADPLYWSPAFDKPREPYDGPEIHTQEQASAVAARLGVEGAMGEETINAQSSAIPLIEDRQVVRFVGAGIAANVLLDSVTMPARHGLMALQARRLRTLLA